MRRTSPYWSFRTRAQNLKRLVAVISITAQLLRIICACVYLSKGH